jgi:hypothetical protein
MTPHLPPRGLLLCATLSLFSREGGAPPRPAPIPEPPTKIADLGQLQREHLPVTRASRSWFSKAVQQRITVDGRVESVTKYVICHAVEGTEKAFDEVLFDEQPRHLTAVGDGSEVLFAVKAGDVDYVWRADAEDGPAVLGGEPITVLALAEASGDRVLLLGASVDTLRAYTTEPPYETYSETGTTASWQESDEPSHLLWTPSAYAFTWHNDGSHWLRRVDALGHHDSKLVGAVESLASDPEGDCFYTVQGEEKTLYATDTHATRVVMAGAVPVKGCERIVSGGGVTAVCVRSDGTGRVLRLSGDKAKDMDFEPPMTDVTVIAGGEFLWTIAKASDPHVWRWDGEAFQQVGPCDSSAEWLVEYAKGTVHVEGTKVIRTDADGTAAMLHDFSSGAVTWMSCGDRPYLIVEDKGSSALYYGRYW